MRWLQEGDSHTQFDQNFALKNRTQAMINELHDANGALDQRQRQKIHKKEDVEQELFFHCAIELKGRSYLPQETHSEVQFLLVFGLLSGTFLLLQLVRGDVIAPRTSTMCLDRAGLLEPSSGSLPPCSAQCLCPPPVPTCYPSWPSVPRGIRSTSQRLL
ncbi:hypothetical protein HPP92_006969 [Vanilla planifolia]|uniref:Uncharacterized protein n=1 Tax=Vanilla planifolia TaxID=51239 RepID=A0A835VBF2_VANPL|nr:hypothetical protein HPP92_007204 [Vanilla planifolia]KAG0490106.1 hypothetical protein HPP92_006969 [Vanilla planifolia]